VSLSSRRATGERANRQPHPDRPAKRRRPAVLMVDARVQRGLHKLMRYSLAQSWSRRSRVLVMPSIQLLPLSTAWRTCSGELEQS
jgi:hypothetical protein